MVSPNLFIDFCELFNELSPLSLCQFEKGIPGISSDTTTLILFGGEVELWAQALYAPFDTLVVNGLPVDEIDNTSKFILYADRHMY